MIEATGGLGLSVGLGPLSAALLLFAANVLSPGPNVFNTIATAMGSGRRSALAAASAVALGVGWWAALALGGAAALFAAVPGARVALTALGGALLIWFGWRFLRRARAAWAQPETVSARRVGPVRAFGEALAIQLANPKALTTWLMLVSVYPVAAAGLADLALFAGASMAVSLVGHVAYALAFSTRPAAAAYARAAWAVLGGVGLAFLALGAGLLGRALAIFAP